MNAKLMECVMFWTQTLRLEDWRIAVQEAPPGALEKNDSRAQVDMRPFQREATIVLRSLEKFDAGTEDEIVHELLHLVFAQYALCIGRDEAQQLPMEQGINAVGNALVSLRASGIVVACTEASVDNGRDDQTKDGSSLPALPCAAPAAPRETYS